MHIKRHWRGVRMNRCNVKYIDISSIDTAESVNTIDKFVRRELVAFHNEYRGLHKYVFENAPSGYVCVEPLALHHEVLWPCGIAFRNNDRGVHDGKGLTPSRD